MKLQDIDITGIETLFLDRDGVINVHRPNDYVKSWEEFIFLPGVKETLATWSKQLKHILVVTNQRGVGRGIMSEEALIDIHTKMKKEIELAGGRIDRIYYCTAIDNSDPNRKPNIGMFQQAMAEFPDIKKEKALMIGDSESDMLFAKSANINQALFRII